MRSLAQLVAVAVIAAVASAASVEAAQRLVIPRNSVGTTQIRNGSIQPADLSRQTVAWLNASAPSPRGRGNRCPSADGVAIHQGDARLPASPSQPGTQRARVGTGESTAERMRPIPKQA